MPPRGLGSESSARPAPPAAGQARRIRALIVEDSEFDFSVLVRVLGQAGFDVDAERVEDEPGMRAALAKRAWDVVISDHNLPRFSSTRALEAFKSSGLDIPFLIVSGEIGEDVAVEAMLAGADDYILKSRLARLAPALQRGLAAAESRALRRESEHALRASEGRLRSIAANLPGIVFRLACGPEEGRWRVEYMSEGTKSLFGVSARELIGDPEPFLACLDAESRLELGAAIREAAGHGAGIRWQGHARGPGAQAPRWIELACTARPGEDGTLLLEGVIMDISAQKSAEEAALRSREELRALSIHFERVKEDERKAIAREVHDDIGGLLASLKFDLAAVRAGCQGQPDLLQRVERMGEFVESARQASDRIMRNLRPSILDQGIVAALEWLARDFGARYGAACRFSANRDAIDLDEEQRNALFRICQEALTNIVKHAHAKAVQIELFASDEGVTLEIADDGAGLRPEALERADRFGIRGMRERAAALGGWMEVNGAPGQGTTVMISIPYTIPT